MKISYFYIVVLKILPFLCGLISIPAESSVHDKILINRLNQWLNTHKTISSRFIQTNPDGTLVEGKMFIRRPNQARFEYDSPISLLLIASGNFLIEVDCELQQVHFYPQVNNIITYLLDTNLLQNPALNILSLNQQNNMITIRLAEVMTNPKNSYIDINFDAVTLDLIGWQVTESNNNRTVITLIESHYNLILEDNLFHFHAPIAWK